MNSEINEQSQQPHPANTSQVSRREFLKRMGLLGGGSELLRLFIYIAFHPCFPPCIRFAAV